MKVLLDSFVLEWQLKINMVSTQVVINCTGVLTLEISWQIRM